VSSRPGSLAITTIRSASSTLAAEFKALNGLGVEALVQRRRMLVGSRAFLAQRGVDAQEWHARAEALRAEAKTVVFLALDGPAAAVAATADPIKESTPEAIAALRRAGIRIVMLTCDS
jgi:Cu+-exporting ATPase